MLGLVAFRPSPMKQLKMKCTDGGGLKIEGLLHHDGHVHLLTVSLEDRRRCY